MSKPKPKKVAYELVDADTADVLACITKDLVEKHHSHLRQASIVFAWAHSWAEDADGLTTLGQAKKVGELERDSTGSDFYLVLNSEIYPQLNEAQRIALIDHELSHCEVVHDRDGEPKRDERDRIVYRLRKHDFQDFAAIVKRHGDATPGFARFTRLAQMQLFPGERKSEAESASASGTPACSICGKPLDCSVAFGLPGEDMTTLPCKDCITARNLELDKTDPDGRATRKALAEMGST